MPQFVVDLIVKALSDRGKALKGARILLLGLAYKADINDIRESPSLDVWHLLVGRSADVIYHDPQVPSLEFGGGEQVSKPFAPETFREADCTVVLTAHSSFDFEMIFRESGCIVDTRNALSKFSGDAKVYKL
jgi:UDP-N-acetyl-D-glucosamine dehydrogenase